jgi:hypothetical protein
MTSRTRQEREFHSRMFNPFFDNPNLNSPSERPRRHWELHLAGPPTRQILERRRRAELITSNPKPKKRQQFQLFTPTSKAKS